jgi:hypothetical protein
MKYLSPPVFDNEEIHSIGSGCLAAAENVLLCLKIHNDYFYEHLLYSKISPSDERKSGRMSRTPSMLDICYWPFMKALYWSWMDDEIKNVRSLHLELKNIIRIYRSLPATYEKALQRLTGANKVSRTYAGCQLKNSTRTLLAAGTI